MMTTKEKHRKRRALRVVVGLAILVVALIFGSVLFPSTWDVRFRTCVNLGSPVFCFESDKFYDGVAKSIRCGSDADKRLLQMGEDPSRVSVFQELYEDYLICRHRPSQRIHSRTDRVNDCDSYRTIVGAGADYLPMIAERVRCGDFFLASAMEANLSDSEKSQLPSREKVFSMQERSVELLKVWDASTDPPPNPDK